MQSGPMKSRPFIFLL